MMTSQRGPFTHARFQSMKERGEKKAPCKGPFDTTKYVSRHASQEVKGLERTTTL